MLRTRITTTDQLIDYFGGTMALAKLLRIGPANVSRWRRDDGIPPSHHMPLYAMVLERGDEIDTEAVFGVRLPDRLVAAE